MPLRALVPLWFALGLLAAPGPVERAEGLLDRCRYAESPDHVWVLPPELNEISGLAWVGRDRVLAHDDERGRIYLLDLAGEQVAGSWALVGEPADDFEGIAIGGNRLYLLTSAGRLYQTGIPASPGRLKWDAVDTGLGRDCEFEGLAWDSAGGVLLFPCKEIRRGGKGTALRLYRWNPSGGESSKPERLELPAQTLDAHSKWDRFAASAVELDPATGHLLLLSGRQAALLELDRAGGFVALWRLQGRYHRQAEGLALAPGGDLLIADEAGGRRATLSRYRCRS